MPNNLPLSLGEAYDRICWSADVADLPTLLGHLDRMPRLRKIKIDRLFVETNGFDVFDALADRADLKVFYDAKYIEIPPKLEALAETACARPIWMVNCMAGSVSNGQFQLTGELTQQDLDGLKRFADVCHASGVRPCAVSVLTTKTEGIVRAEFHGRSRNDQVLKYADVVLNAGFTHMVCSPMELVVIRNESKFDHLRLDTPGVRPAGATKDDQVNADTPRATLEAGSDLLIIGRPITEGPTGDPAQDLDNIATSTLAA